MANSLELARLMAWLSPVFPTGSFAYSSGLEAAVANNAVTDQSTLKDWLISLMIYGRLRNDAIYLNSAVQEWQDADALGEINQLALAGTGSAELQNDAVAQGNAFVVALEGWPDTEKIIFPEQVILPVAVGAACGSSDIGAKSATIAFVHAFLTNQLQIAIRLSVMGQTGASAILADLEPHIIKFAEATEFATLEDLGNSAFIADIMSMHHETQNGRMFRS